MSITFGPWPKELHDDWDQQTRIESAKKAATSPSSIDKETCTGIFPGSGRDLYHTSLSTCTCGDFLRRHRPCKHMYRLAMECGLIEGTYKTGENKNTSASKFSDCIITDASFGDWPLEIHSDLDQQSRFESAKKPINAPLSVDKATCCGTFHQPGFEPYQTTLSSCSCRDYYRRKLPCIHIYRLAMECGLIENNFEASQKKRSSMPLQLDLKEVIEEIDRLPVSCQQFIRDGLRETLYHNTAVFFVSVNDETRPLLDCKLIDCLEAPLAKILKKMKKPEILARIPSCDAKLSKLKKPELIDWCIDNCPQIRSSLPKMVDLTFSKAFQKTQHSAYRYLNKKLYPDPRY